MSVCFKCKLSANKGDVRNVKSKGRRSLLEAAIIRGDTDIETMLRDENSEIIAHGKCYKEYGDVRSAVAAGRRKSQQLESSQMDIEDEEGEDDDVQPGPSSESHVVDPIFDSDVCFICENAIDNDYKKGGKRKSSLHTVYVVKKTSVKERLINLLSEHKDAHSLGVLSKIRNVDLVKAGGRYHLSCIRNLNRKNEGFQEEKGRSSSPVDAAMQYVYYYLENCYDCQITVKHLADQIPENIRPSEKTITNRIQSKYGDEILSYQARGAGTIICFKDTGRQLLSENWYKSKSADKTEEKKKSFARSSSYS